jgi:MFS family permease
MLARAQLGPLRERPFRLLFLGQTASGIGDAIVFIALVFAVLRIGSESDLGFVLAAFWGFRAACTVIGGVWADRLPRRLVMLVCDAIRAAVEFFTAVMLLSGSMRIWMFIVTAAMFGAASAFFQPASTGLMPQLVSPQQLQQANALLGVSRGFLNVAGPSVSGVLVALFGPGWVFGIDGVTFVASAAFLFALPVPAHARAPRQRFLTDLARGWHEVRSRTWLLASIVAFSITNVSIAAGMVLGPIVARADLGGAKAYGVIGTGGAVGGILGSVLALRLRPSRPLVAQFLITLPCAAPLLLFIPPAPVAAIAVGNAAFVAGIACGYAMWETGLQSRIPNEALSRVASYDLMVSFIFMPLGLALAGWSAHAIGVDSSLAIAAALVFVTNFGVLLVPSVRNFRREPERASEPEREWDVPAQPAQLPSPPR